MIAVICVPGAFSRYIDCKLKIFNCLRGPEHLNTISTTRIVRQPASREVLSSPHPLKRGFGQ